MPASAGARVAPPASCGAGGGNSLLSPASGTPPPEPPAAPRCRNDVSGGVGVVTAPAPNCRNGGGCGVGVVAASTPRSSQRPHIDQASGRDAQPAWAQRCTTLSMGALESQICTAHSVSAITWRLTAPDWADTLPALSTGRRGAHVGRAPGATVAPPLALASPLAAPRQPEAREASWG